MGNLVRKNDDVNMLKLPHKMSLTPRISCGELEAAFARSGLGWHGPYCTKDDLQRRMPVRVPAASLTSRTIVRAASTSCSCFFFFYTPPSPAASPREPRRRTAGRKPQLMVNFENIPS